MKIGISVEPRLQLWCSCVEFVLMSMINWFTRVHHVVLVTFSVFSEPTQNGYTTKGALQNEITVLALEV